MEKWYQINNKASGAEILLYDQVGQRDGTGVTAKQFINDLNALKVNEITVRINSPGGNVFDGNAIYNSLKAHRARINVKVDGLAASIASVIAMAGDHIEMPENAMMMVHNPWGMVIGHSGDMRQQADALDKIKLGSVAAYRNKSGKSDHKISNMMDDETWLTAAEAVDLGFADKMLEPVQFQANFELLNRYVNTPSILGEKTMIFKTKKETRDGNEDFMAMVGNVVDKKGCTKTEAMMAIMKSHPDVHEAYIKKVNERR